MSVRITSADRARLLTARAKLLRWFSRNGRSFFWRKVERNPYRVLVTEFMLQQTQTFRVEEYLPRFLQKFPTLKSLADVPSGEVIKTWQGLGYNRRALNLHKTAHLIANEYEGNFPQDDRLLQLPGVGEYTMRALQVFAFGKRTSVADVNVVRVLSRISKKQRTTKSMLRVVDVHAINTSLLPRNAAKWHEALMDLGATICKAKPACNQCPVQYECSSYSTLSKAKHSGTKKNPNEKIYFGKPKRLWRGIVLKLIAENRSVSPEKLEGLIPSHTMPSEFSLFIRQVADELAGEELCTVDRGRYRLAQK